jgi:2-C-methyl-D-erythritol 4-phosphate cytidylyltransferase
MGAINKIFAPLKGKPLLAWSVDVCHKCSLIEQIVITLNDKDWELGERLKEDRGWPKVTLCLGGPRRQDSVREGLSQLKECAWVLVHDGARPFLTSKLIEDGLKMARESGAAIAAVPVKDTIKLAEDDGLIKKTLPRHKLWISQTPQVFQFNIITRAYKELKAEVNDDAAAVEQLGYKVKLYMGDHNNIKVTTPEDLALAELIAQDIERE